MCVFSPRLTGLDTQIVNKKEHQADDTWIEKLFKSKECIKSQNWIMTTEKK